MSTSPSGYVTTFGEADAPTSRISRNHFMPWSGGQPEGGPIASSLESGPDVQGGVKVKAGARLVIERAPRNVRSSLTLGAL